MSSTRLVISNELLEALRQLHQAAIAFEKEHTTDGLYDRLLQKPLREQRDDTRIDFVEDFVTNFALVSRAQEKAISSEHINIQVVYAGSIPLPIAKLTYCSKLLKEAFADDAKKQDTCDFVINELNSLNNHIQGILLTGYKNHFNTLITLLNKLGTAPQQYKQTHQNDVYLN
ncbi:MAG TPA: hypothetical protein VHA13_03420 [Gammaproteobacteria bacterium]|nr:hypothetical protein [Gammaproteobacteria bacterium]